MNRKRLASSNNRGFNLRLYESRAIPEVVAQVQAKRKRVVCPSGPSAGLCIWGNAADYFGWSAHFAAINNLASSQRARE
jgi:hypothetical protein